MGEGGLRLRLRVLDVKQVVHGLQVPAQLLAGKGIRVLLELRDDLVIFNDMQYFFVHNLKTSKAYEKYGFGPPVCAGFHRSSHKRKTNVSATKT